MTGPEIWEQTQGKVTAWVASTGTGGTLSGTAKYLKEVNSNIKVFLADPPGSCLFNYIKSGKLDREGDNSITEGIGNGRATENLKAGMSYIDDALFIPDQLSIKMTFRLLHEEGLAVGVSSGLNVVAAVEVAK